MEQEAEELNRLRRKLVMRLEDVLQEEFKARCCLGYVFTIYSLNYSRPSLPVPMVFCDGCYLAGGRCADHLLVVEFKVAPPRNCHASCLFRV